MTEEAPTPSSSSDRATDPRATTDGAPDRALRLVFLVVVVGAVVAVAAGGVQLLTLPVALEGGWVRVMRLMGIGIVAASIWFLLSERQRLRAAGVEGPDPAFVALRTAGTIMAVMFLLGLFNAPRMPSDGASTFRPGLNSGFVFDGPGERESDDRTRGGDPIVRGQPFEGFFPEALVVEVDGSDPITISRFIPRLILIVLILVLARNLARRLAPRRVPLGFEFMLAPDRAQASLERSLSELVHFGDDPRGQITRAYHILLDALEEAGAARELHEAPHEHLYRVLGPLGVRPQPLHELTSLYVLAQFGGRPVSEEHRSAAAAALEVSLADVRAHAARTGELVPA